MNIALSQRSIPRDAWYCVTWYSPPPSSPCKVRIERRSNCNRVLTQSRKNWDRRRFARSRIAATTAAAILFPSAFAPPVIQPRYLHGWLFFVIWAGGGGGRGGKPRITMRGIIVCGFVLSLRTRVSRSSLLFLILFLPFVSPLFLLCGAQYCTSHCLLVKLVKPASETFILM